MTSLSVGSTGKGGIWRIKAKGSTAFGTESLNSESSDDFVESLDRHRRQQRPRPRREQADVGAGVFGDPREQRLAAFDLYLDGRVLPVGAVHGQLECHLIPVLQ